MKLFKASKRSSALAIAVAFCAVVGANLQSFQASAASSYVQGSYSAAMQFADEFCRDTSSDGVGPSLNGFGDLVWITAPDGGTTITANQGDLYAPVTVHIAGKYCSNYNGYGAGSNYYSDQGSITGQLLYGGNQANTTFYVSEPASLYIGNFSTGTHRINMGLSSFFTLSGGMPAGHVPSPNAWTDLNIQFRNQWSINGQSYVRKSTSGANSQGTITANLNDTIYFSHDLRNNGPDNMDRSIYYNVDKGGYSGSEAWVNGDKRPNGWASGVAGQLFVTSYPTGSPFSVKTIYQHDVGAGYNGRAEICQRIAWQDKAWNDGSWGWSVPSACVRVPYNYNLIPSVTGPSGMGSVGSKIPTVTPRVNNALSGNAGATTKSPDNVEWQLKRIEIDPDGSYPTTQQENNNAPCSHYNNGGANDCIDKGSGTRSFPAGMTTLAVLSNETISADALPGAKICYTLSVRPYSQSSDQSFWRHSAPVCITVSRQPKVQVWGHDLRTRGSIETGTTIISSGGTDRLFGSWVEYGGFSVGGNNGFASGSGLNNGNTSIDNEDPWHQLTFANVNNAGSSNYGSYTLPSNLPTLTDQFIGSPSGGALNGDVDLGAIDSGTYTANDVTIIGGDVGQTDGKGKAIIIAASGTVTITGNIVYKGTGAGDSFSSITELPQVIIIAENINITNAATQIDAWLLTTGPDGAINTCSDVNLGLPLNANVCNNRLTVNGPVATQHLHLRRTAGSDDAAQAGDPAEVFNLRSDAYLWAQARAGQAGKAQTVYSVELPPRF